MPDKILHKRSLTPGSLPTTSSLDIGELAINIADGKIHIRRSGSAGNDIVSLVTANTITTGSITATNFTGSIQGTASWANNSISSSYVLSSSFANVANTVNTLNQSVFISGSLTVIGNIILEDTSVINSSWLYDTNTSGSIAWSNRQLYDTSENTSINWQSRQLLDDTGNSSVLTWGGVKPEFFGTSSYAIEALSSSFAVSASWAPSTPINIDTGSFATTGSNTFSGTQIFSGSINISGSATLNSGSIVSSNTIQKIETLTSASYAAITPVSGTLYIIIG